MLTAILQETELPTELVGEATESISLLELILNGGFMMIPLFILWMIGIYVFAERMMMLRKAAQTPEDFKDRIRQLVVGGDIQGARMMCVQTDTPAARMIEKGITKIGSTLKNIEVSIENLGKIEIYRLEKNLNLLATIAGAAPMIGFLGTVAGMIQAFMAVAQEEGAVSPKLLSGGIYEALITTAAGLVVGILAYLGYNYLVGKVSKVIHTMEYNAIEFVELLQEPQKK